jgi:HrpA-like RNA helicase
VTEQSVEGAEIRRPRVRIPGDVYVPKMYTGKMRRIFRARQRLPEYQRMQQERSNLPISQYRDKILNSLKNSNIVMLVGETGW